MADQPVDNNEIFDLSLKKKKKKKKPVVEDEEIFEEGAQEFAAMKLEDNKNQEASTEAEAASTDDFSMPLKKKKKKKVLIDDDSAPASAGGADAGGDAAAAEDVGMEDLMLPSKKKKKKKNRLVLPADGEGELGGVDGGDDDVMEAPASASSGPHPWSGSDRDYMYTELLSRVFDIMRAKNPDMVAGEKRRFVMKPPQVVRIGTKKSAFVNFAEICKLLHRQSDHVLAFLFSELGTSGSLDGSNQLTIKGRFQQKQIENVLRRYIREYVTCHTCRSPDTILTKENRIFFLQCEVCGSRCSVAAIKSGFQAVTGKRAQIRNQQ